MSKCATGCIRSVIVTADTNSIDLSGNGNPLPLSADLIVDPAADNQLSVSALGAYVPPTPHLPVWANASLGDSFVTATVPAAPVPLTIQSLTAAQGGFIVGGNPWQLLVPEDGLYMVSAGVRVCDNPTPGCFPTPATQRMLTMVVRVGPNIKRFARRTTTAPETISGVGGDEATSAEAAFLVRAKNGDPIQVEVAMAFDTAGIPGSFNPDLGTNRLWVAKVAD